MSISIQNVTKYYGNQCVLNNINFSIKSGEIVGFLGPNGAGKSTTMKSITGFIPYDSGSIKVCNLEVKDHPLDIKRMIGYLPEHNPLYLDMYVKEYLKFVGEMYGLSGNISKRVNEMIDLTGLGLEQHKKIGQLSKGYRQRVGLAQALIHDPAVLILDEPTTGLDPNQLVDVRNLISEIGKEKTVMLSTHIMQEVNAICDRVIIINKGNIVADEQEEVITTANLKNFVFTVELGEKITAEILREIKGVENVIQDKSTLFRLESTQDIRAEIFRFVAERGLTLLTLNQQERNMESVFREMTRG